MSAIGLLLLPLILVFVVLIPILVGVYVYRDAKARRMDAVLWTIIAVIAPGLSLIHISGCTGPAGNQQLSMDRFYFGGRSFRFF